MDFRVCKLCDSFVARNQYLFEDKLISCAICSMSILERFVQIFERYLQFLSGWAFRNQPSVKCDGADHNELSSKLPICHIFIFFSLYIYLNQRMMIFLLSYLFSCPGSSIPTLGYHWVCATFLDREWFKECCMSGWKMSHNITEQLVLLKSLQNLGRCVTDWPGKVLKMLTHLKKVLYVTEDVAVKKM